MKRIIGILLLVIVSIVAVAAPVYAADPPPTNVVIGVSSPGNINSDINLAAGGNLTVSVNGDGLATQKDLQGIYSGFSGLVFTDYDWALHKVRDEIIPYLISMGADFQVVQTATSNLILLRSQDLDKMEGMQAQLAGIQKNHYAQMVSIQDLIDSSTADQATINDDLAQQLVLAKGVIQEQADQIQLLTAQLGEQSNIAGDLESRILTLENPSHWYDGVIVWAKSVPQTFVRAYISLINWL